MNLMKYRILLFMTLIVIKQGHAQQLQIGVETGLSVALTQENFQLYNGSSTIKKYRLGGRFGIPVELRLSDKFKLNSGFFYEMKGNVNYPLNAFSTEHQTMTISYSTIGLPVCITYMRSEPDKNNFFIGIGPYVAYGIVGKVRYYDVVGNAVEQKASWGTTPGKSDIKPLDLGVQMQAGIFLKNGLICRFVLQRGLNDMAVSKEVYLNNRNLPQGSFTQIKNQAYASLSVAYFLKHKH